MTDRIVCIRCGRDGHRSGQCQWPAEIAQPPKRKGRGVHTLDDIKDRCFVDEMTGCWIWRACRDSNEVPSLYVPALKRVSSLGFAIGFLRTGVEPARGVLWHCICETKQCANPDHRKAGTKSSAMLAAKIKHPPQVRARMIAAQRRNAKLSQADADAIRGTSMKLLDIAERYGITAGYACQIRSGKLRKPLAAPGSSVFGWGGMA